MINELLEKFYNGDTTSQEERQLLELLENTSEQKYQADLKLLRSLHAEMPDFGDMAQIASQTKPNKLSCLPRLEAAAAAVIIFAAAGAYFHRPVVDVYPQELTVEQAREKTILALTALSNGVNRGYEEIEKLNDL